MSYPILPVRILALVEEYDTSNGEITRRLKLEIFPGCVRDVAVSSAELRRVQEILSGGEPQPPPPPPSPPAHPHAPPPPPPPPPPAASLPAAPPPPAPGPRRRPMVDGQGNPIMAGEGPSGIDHELHGMF